MSDIFNVVIGTAGHIDHGKSTIVLKLTGIDPDRLKEEKERGMTIDLGFAPLTLPSGEKVGIIDVPGHERFIRNMVAGATGIDFVILAVAADDGVMPQTREHLDIIELLGIKKGIIALTKIDIVEKDLRELAIEDVKEFLKGTFLENAPIYPISNVTGEGFEEFKNAIFQSIIEFSTKSNEGLFRMPIQRVFSRHGYGTIVTGVPLSGMVHKGDTLEILPEGFSGKVRNIQAYMENTELARRGHSTALNISDIDYKLIKRGDVVATPGYFKASRFIEANLKHLDSYRHPLKNYMEIKFHTGTAEIMGKMILLDDRELPPGAEGYVQFILDEPVVTEIADRYVIRQSSPPITIGGGSVIGIGDRKLRRLRPWIIEGLQEKEALLNQDKDRVEWILKNCSEGIIKLEKILVEARLSPERVKQFLEELKDSGDIIETHSRYIHKDRYKKAQEDFIKGIEEYYKSHTHKIWVDKWYLREGLDIDSSLYEFLLEELTKQGLITQNGDLIALSTREIKLSKEDEYIIKQIEDAYLSEIFSPPSKDQTFQKINNKKEKVESIFAFLLDKGILVEIEKELYFHKDAIEKARDIILEEVKKHGELIPANFRDRLNSTRKYIIPLLEYFDKIGLTVRDGNRRILR